jgi:hypothetical protein
MKIFKDKEKRKKIVRIAIYAVAIFAIRYLAACNREFLEYSSFGRFLSVLELTLAVFLAWTIFSLAKNRAKAIYAKTKKVLANAIKRMFKPFIEKFLERQKRKQKFVRGLDENKIIFDFHVMDRLKNRLKPKKKLDLKHVSSNAEKIKLLYIKFILTLAKKNHAVKYSSTPKEIKNNLGNGDDILFDTYEQVRYDADENIDVLDNTVELCENAVDDF